MTAKDFERAQEIYKEISKLIEIRNQVSKNPFVITQNGKETFNMLAPEDFIKKYLPMTNEQYNRDFLNKINSEIQSLKKQFEEL